MAGWGGDRIKKEGLSTEKNLEPRLREEGLASVHSIFPYSLYIARFPESHSEPHKTPLWTKTGPDTRVLTIRGLLFCFLSGKGQGQDG